MYEKFFGLSGRPFSMLPDPSFLYLGSQHSAALVMLEYGLISRAGFIVITGEIGSGKTTLIRHILEEMEDDVTEGLISHTHDSFGELLQWMLLAFGLDYKGKSNIELYETFVEFLIDEYRKGQRTVLIIDEAQNIGASTLEQLRLISNINADEHLILQVVLVGQPELRDTLGRPELEQFAQRIAVDYHIDRLDAEQVRDYIRHRMSVVGGDPETFADDACDLIHVHSGGVPRLVNTLCDTGLVYAYGADKKHVDAELVAEVVEDKVQSGLFRTDTKSRTDARSSIRSLYADDTAVPDRRVDVEPEIAYELFPRSRRKIE